MNKTGELKPQEDETSSQATPNSSSDQEKKKGGGGKQADRREAFQYTRKQTQDKFEIIFNPFSEM